MMTKIKHPLNHLERLKIKKKKDEKRQKTKDTFGHVKRKLLTEFAKDKETEHELRETLGVNSP